MMRGGILAVLLALTVPTQASEWRMDASRSRLAFVAAYQQQAAPGAFRQFDTILRFDPRKPADGRLQVKIAIGSADMGSGELNEGMQTAEWFNTAQYPDAQFTSESIRDLGAGRYLASGVLRLKGIERKLAVPFSWEPHRPDGATLTGELKLDRTWFQIGTGEWAVADPIGLQVTVTYHVVFKRQD